MDLKQYVSEVQDWPKPGVSFKDITTIMDNGKAYGYATDQIVEYAREKMSTLLLGQKHEDLLLVVSSIFNGHRVRTCT